MTVLQHERNRRRIWRMVCSEPWLEAVLYRGAKYPPGGAKTLMRTCVCPRCDGRRWWPPQVMLTSGWAYECWLNYYKLAELLPSSPGSVLDIARMRRCRAAGLNYTV